MEALTGGAAPPPPPPAAPTRPSEAAPAPKKKVRRHLGLTAVAAPVVAPAAPVLGVATPQSVPVAEEAAASLPSGRPPRDPASAASGRRERGGKRLVKRGARPLAVDTAAAAVVFSQEADNVTPSTPESPTVAAQAVFDEMPPSMDDVSFLNMMDSDTFNNNSSPLAFNLDGLVEGEGFVDPSPKRGSRQANYTIDEDVALVNAWQTITLDPISGVEQSGNTYWERIHDHYHRNKKSGCGERSRISLTHRWQTIQDSCSKWASCVEQVTRLNPSGTTDSNKEIIAQQLYMNLNMKKGSKLGGKGFALMHCWVLLRHDEKWKTRNNEVPNKKCKTTSSNSPETVLDSEDSNSDDDGGVKSSPTPSSATPSNKRPPGRKSEKERLKKGGDSAYSVTLESMMTTRKELAAERKEEKAARWIELKELEERWIAFEERRVSMAERRIAIEERMLRSKQEKQEQRLMFMNPEGLDAKGRAYFELMRDQVLASKGGFMGGYGGHGGDHGGYGGNGGSSSAMGDDGRT